MTQVTLLDTIELATFCVRTFSLHKVRGDLRSARRRITRTHKIKTIIIQCENKEEMAFLEMDVIRKDGRNGINLCSYQINIVFYLNVKAFIVIVLPVCRAAH